MEKEYNLLYPKHPSIKLTFKDTGLSVTIAKPQFEAGRHMDCHLRFDNQHKYIARKQATFLYENGVWYCADMGSLNGTWLNGEKMTSKKLYRLERGDVLDFAKTQEIIVERFTSDVTKE